MSVYGSLKDKEKITSYRTTIETAFYRNNVQRVDSVAEAYFLAENSEGTIVTDIPVYEPEFHGLPSEAKILVFNDGEVIGRCAQARRIAGTAGVDPKIFSGILREAVYNTRFKTMYHAQAVIGLHEDFMVKANLLVPENYENTMLSWLLNFQALDTKYKAMYERSKPIDDLEIFVFSDPDWRHPDFPLGLTFFDPTHNVAALLGMRYFGEFKKGTLTLAWGTANRHGYASCHGGVKRYDDKGFVAAVFGLSGSGKSTLTHAKHGGKYKTTVCHDDAFIISMKDGSTIALEPSYFDKTADYAIGATDNKYILTAQNIGVSLDDDGNTVLVTEDFRNGNGRAVKSRLWSPNRVDKLEEPVSAIFWLMKDPTLPPLTRVENPILASTMGATLATKRTSAERVVGVSLDKLVVEPYANPFRTYPLSDDYNKFKQLIEQGVPCYVLNTGAFMGKDITKEITIGLLEDIIEGRERFVSWPDVDGLSYSPVDGYEPDMKNSDYRKAFKERMADRLDFIQSRDEETQGFDKLPDECAEAIQSIVDSL